MAAPATEMLNLVLAFAKPALIEGCAIATVPASIIDAARMNENTFFIIKKNIKLFNVIEIRDESQTLKVIPDFQTVTKISNFKPFLQNITKIVR